jgi:hypothetical protein
MVVAFPGNRFRGEIVPALKELVDGNIMRIIDLAFVSKDREGNTVALELEDVDSEVGAAFRQIEAEAGDLINEDDLRAVAEALETNSSAAVLIWEDVWAAKLATAIRNADGVLVNLERIPRDVVEAAIAYAGSKETAGRTQS